MKRIIPNFEDELFIKKVIRAQKKIDMFAGKKLVIYGAGLHTKYVLDWLDLSDYEIRICDSFKRGQIGGYVIEQPCKELYDWSDSIIVSSFEQQNEILRILIEKIPENKIILLYSENDKVPFFVNQVEMIADNLQNIVSAKEYGKMDKYSAWKTKGAGEVYENRVEKTFFDVVTKELYLNYIEKGDNVLDVGAGTGRLSIEIKKHGAKVTSVDTSAEMLRIIHKKDSDIDTVVVVDEKLPFNDEQFDKVVSCDAMIHFVNWKVFLKEHYRVLKKSGYIIYNMYNDQHLQDISTEKNVRASYITGENGYYATVTKSELEAVCNEIGGLDLIEMIPYNFFSQCAFSYGLLTRGEMMNLQKYYNALCGKKECAEVIRRFEKDIVAKLPAHMTACNICVFRKKDE